MDVKEASAMTEASGLTEGQLESASHEPRASPFETQLRSSMARFAEQLRRTTIEAPLRSLFLAFILGVWVARRR